VGFLLSGLAASEFEHLFGKSETELELEGAVRVAAGEAFPCRVTLRDAEPGEAVLLLTYEHQPGATPYRSSGPIYVREGNHPTAVLDRIPDEMRGRLFSVRAYDAEHQMVEADVASGADLETLIETLFSDPRASYLHVHHARRGCFAFKVDRA
jgi:hypothetical protein